MIGLTTTLGEYLETLDYARVRNAVRLVAAIRGVRSLSETLPPATIACLDNLTEDSDFCANLGDAYAELTGGLPTVAWLGRELHNVLGLDSDDGECVAVCVVCGEMIDCCAGHGEDYARDVARLFRGWLARRESISESDVDRWWFDCPAGVQDTLIDRWVSDTQDAIDYDGNVLGEWLELQGFDNLD